MYHTKCIGIYWLKNSNETHCICYYYIIHCKETNNICFFTIHVIIHTAIYWKILIYLLIIYETIVRE